MTRNAPKRHTRTRSKRSPLSSAELAAIINGSSAARRLRLAEKLEHLAAIIRRSSRATA